MVMRNTFFVILLVLIKHIRKNISSFAPEIQILDICTRNF